jgi:hypothetical protein
MNPLQRAAYRRKVIYLAAILGLFTLSMFWRGTLDIPLSRTARAGEAASSRLPDRLASGTILNRSLALELREVEEGEQELEGSAFRLALIGSRGFVIAYLWNSVIHSQMRNDFHKMDDRIQTVTQLQPHFITPWVFQSWNIAYNVSVEMQGSGDMYYYIARGIELLAEGERRQGRYDPETQRRIGSPDMRYWIAFTYQNKFGVSDNVEVLRCLFQMSCIPPNDRNAEPGGLTNADGTVNLEKFREFCVKYPHLVRRLRGEYQTPKSGDEQTNRHAAEALKCPRPENVIQFLRENKDVPTRYKYAKELFPAERQFPILPQKFNEGQNVANPEMELDDDFSAYMAAKAWYAFSLVPLPPVPLDANDKPLPAPTPQPGEYDPVKFRVPRSPMLIIFRQGGPRAQSAQAEMEQKEGWFDDEGWRIDDPRDSSQNWWFPDAAGTHPLDVVIGREQPWSGKEWQKAAQMWLEHGERYGLSVPAERLRSYEEERKSFGSHFDPNPALLEDPAYRRRFYTAMAPFYYKQNRDVTNFPFFLASATGEQRPTTIAARKILWQAEQARKVAEKAGPRGAIALYEKGLRMWRDVLLADREFHRPERSDRADEETYTYELAYLRLIVQDDERVRAKAREVALQIENACSGLPFPFSATWRSNETTARIEAACSVLPFPFNGAWVESKSPLTSTDVQTELRWFVAETDPTFSPFVGVINVDDDRKGTPWVRNDLKESVRIQQGVQRRKPSEANGPSGAPPVPNGMPAPPTRDRP